MLGNLVSSKNREMGLTETETVSEGVKPDPGAEYSFTSKCPMENFTKLTAAPKASIRRQGLDTVKK